MLIAIVPLLAAILGLLVYVLASNSKAVELGRLTYFAGILVTLLVAARHMVKLI
jgi:hypothetical protein